VKRKQISYRESVELAQDDWDDFAGDGFGLSLVLMPVTSIWYCMRGAPVARQEAAAARRRQSGMQTSRSAVVLTYATGILGLMLLIGVVIGMIVFIV
jgi:ABC-type cobalamin transport system permease subunit